MNIGMVLSGGAGTRFGGKIPKQYRKIYGKEVIDYVLEAVTNAKNIDRIVVVSRKEEWEGFLGKYQIETVECGCNRNESLKNGLDYIKQNYNCDKIIILEAARPMVTPEIIEDYIHKLDEYDSVITGQRITDSLGSLFAHTIDRENYYLIQAPEAFRFNMLYDSFNVASKITATNQQMPKESRLFINFNFTENHKITYKQDLYYVKCLLTKRQGKNV